MNKEYKNAQELIASLENGKRLKIGTVKPALFLEKTYLDAFTPYFDFVATGRDTNTKKRKYDSETDFSVYQKLSSIDENISLALHIYIGAFEKRLRAFVIGELCSEMRAEGDAGCICSETLRRYESGQQVICLSSSNDFSLWEEKWKSKNEKLCQEEARQKTDRLKSEITAQRIKAVKSLAECFGTSCKMPSPIAKHYQNKYKSVPAFVGMHTLSLGTTALLFGMLPRESQNRFWKSYCRRPDHCYSDGELTGFLMRLKRIVDIRNVINHYEPLFPTICEIHPASVNSFITIVNRLKSNYALSVTEAPFSPQKLPLPVARISYNQEKYDIVLKVINAI